MSDNHTSTISKNELQKIDFTISRVKVIKELQEDDKPIHNFDEVFKPIEKKGVIYGHLV